jgi:EAL domain-containing protein (putative c-di-GMP-specific phosphodiesterase class I)
MGILEFVGKLFHPSDITRSPPSSLRRDESPDEKLPSDPTRPAPPEQAGAEGQSFDSGLRALVENRKASKEALIAGSVAIVGLDDIKAALGERWEISAKRVLTLAHSEIRKRLLPDDIMRSEQDGLFSICFASPNQQEAQEKASRISKEVKQALLRDMPEFSATLVVRKYVTDIALDDLGSDPSSLAERLGAAMARLRLETDNARLHYRKTLLREFQIYYAPVWDPQAERLVMNRCVIDLTMGFTTLSQFQAIADPDQMADTLADLDCVVLARALEALHNVRQSQPGASVIVPVGFQTLAGVRSHAEFTRLLESIPDGYRPSLVLEITAIPASATAERVQTVLDTLAAYTNRTLLQLNGNPAIVDALDARSLWGVAWNLTGWDRPGTTQQNFGKFVIERAVARKLVTIAHGANSISQAVSAVELGFNYVDGTAIHLSVDAPRAPAKLHPLTYPRARKL